MFDIHPTKSYGYTNVKLFETAGKTPVVVNSSMENGIGGYVDLNPTEKGNIITYSDTTTSDGIFYQPYDFIGYSHIQGLYPLNNVEWSKNALLCFVAVFRKCAAGKFDYGNKFNRKIAAEMKIHLPTKDGEIDFDFMENFIAELEAQRYAELEAYLSVTGLKDTHLSLEEEQALRDFDKIQWGTYKIGDLFERVVTKKLPYTAKELPKQPTTDCPLPCLTSSFQNQGLNYYVPKAGATIISNVISLPSNSDVYRAYYQSREFTVLSDSYAIRWKTNHGLSRNQYLFAVMCINKVTDLSIYSYKNKLGGWNVVKNKYIKLPQKNHEIDFALMDSFISAIQKIAIRDVVAYSNKKRSAVKKAIDR